MDNNLGYYFANGKKYTNKIQAILEAQKTLSEVTWDFHRNVFDQINWKEEPLLSLDELYKMRAQQIRDKYDYVIIMCSGGADSTNVVKSFLNNNIHVDEIIGSAPLEGLKNWNWDDKNTSANNTMSETKFALFPLLHEISVNYPQVKITINDFFEDILKSKTDEWLYKCPDWINCAITTKGDLNKFTYLKDFAEQGKRIAVVWGCDKPILRYDINGNVYTMISDLGVNNAVQPFDQHYPNVDPILFYWGPEMPEVLLKQSHVVAKFIHKKENLWISNLVKDMSKLKNWNGQNIEKTGQWKGDYQRGIVPAIYASTWRHVFQAQKSTISFLSPQSSWLETLHKGTRIVDQFQSDFNLFYKSINPLYLDEQKHGFKHFHQMYNIGHYTNFIDVIL
jgi:hypothetical protein